MPKDAASQKPTPQANPALTTPSKTAQVLRYFAQHYGGPGVPRKRLVKLAYMADILSRQYL
ncbi:MAG: hypothetical protein M3365_11955, partial [Gemmatimonadota bacterium]|nr:hypothetical protein [Gemmatimonadota bacterium]